MAKFLVVGRTLCARVLNSPRFWSAPVATKRMWETLGGDFCQDLGGFLLVKLDHSGAGQMGMNEKLLKLGSETPFKRFLETPDPKADGDRISATTVRAFAGI